MTPELITLAVVLISIVWGTIQHHWTEDARKRDALEIAIQRRADAKKLEEDRILLAVELENRREATAQAVKDALEQRAAEIRSALDERAAAINAQQEQLAAELEDNTVLTRQAVETSTRAADASAEAASVANDVNAKLARLHENAVTTNEQGNVIMTNLGMTGDETLTRVKRVEDAVVQADAQVAAEAAQTEKRLTRLEDTKQTDQAYQTRRLVETGEDTNARVILVQEAVSHSKDIPTLSTPD